MSQFTYPGVYLKNIPAQNYPPISNVPTTLALVGFTKEGPVNEPILCTDFNELVSKFGDFTEKSTLVHQAFMYSVNGGNRVYIVRVLGDGAEKAQGQLTSQETNEPVPFAFDGTTTVFNLVGTTALDKPPIVPSSITFTVSTGETITDDGNGNLIGDAGATGVIDYNTGEGQITFASAPASGATVTVAYSYVTFRFKMKWEGEAGNEFSVLIMGDEAYADVEHASYNAYVVQVLRTTSAGTNVEEEYKGVVFDDPNAARFIARLINDPIGGSEYIEVEVTGNNESPSGLSGSAVTSELIINTPTYDGSTKQFTYQFANSIQPTTMNVSFTVGAKNENVGVGDGVTTVFNLDYSPDITTTNTVEITVNGNVGTNNTTANQITIGTYTITIGADGSLTFNAAPASGEVISASYRLANKIIVKDDGAGTPYIDSGDALWILDNNGTNSIDYDNGQLVLTWRNTSVPVDGPYNGGVEAWSQVADYYTQAPNNDISVVLSGGLDGGLVTRDDVAGPSAMASGKGIYALDKVDDVLMIGVPDFATDATVAGYLLDYCAGRNDKDRFALVSPPEGATPDKAIAWKKNSVGRASNEYGAAYYPHLSVDDPVTGGNILLPPIGAVAGTFARVHSVYNTATAPAGKGRGELRGIIGIERMLSNDEVGKLNQAHINAIVAWEETGVVIWGARSWQVSGEMPYVNMVYVRMFVSKVVKNALYRYVFQNNTPALRAKVKTAIERLLNTYFQRGLFGGKSPDEAYFVKCDDSNNPPAQVEAGILTVDVGIMLPTVSEFVEVRIQRKLAGKQG